MSGGDIIVLAVVLLMISVALAVVIRNLIKKRNSCGCNCPGCTRKLTCRHCMVQIDEGNSEPQKKD